MSSGSVTNITYKLQVYKYMREREREQDLALNNQPVLIYPETPPINQPEW